MGWLGARGAHCTGPNAPVLAKLAVSFAIARPTPGFTVMTAPSSKRALQTRIVQPDDVIPSGYRSFVASFPAEDATIVALSNGGADVGALTEGLARIFLGEGTAGRKPAAMAPADAAQIAKLAGYYVSDWGPGLELRADGDKLAGLIGGMLRQPGGLLAGGGL